MVCMKMEEELSAWESREAKKGLAAARRRAFTWKFKNSETEAEKYNCKEKKL